MTPATTASPYAPAADPRDSPPNRQDFATVGDAFDRDPDRSTSSNERAASRRLQLEALSDQLATARAARRVIRNETVPDFLMLFAAGAGISAGAVVYGLFGDNPGAALGGVAAGMTAMGIASIGLGANTLMARLHTRTVVQVEAQIRAAQIQEDPPSERDAYPSRSDQDCLPPP